MMSSCYRQSASCTHVSALLHAQYHICVHTRKMYHIPPSHVNGSLPGNGRRVPYGYLMPLLRNTTTASQWRGKFKVSRTLTLVQKLSEAQQQVGSHRLPQLMHAEAERRAIMRFTDSTSVKLLRHLLLTMFQAPCNWRKPYWLYIYLCISDELVPLPKNCSESEVGRSIIFRFRFWDLDSYGTPPASK